MGTWALTRLWQLLYEPGAWHRARSQESQESTEMHMVPGSLHMLAILVARSNTAEHSRVGDAIFF
eukprot:scaffold5905_cov132-Isochrysis_galbana.AAC.3